MTLPTPDDHLRTRRARDEDQSLIAKWMDDPEIWAWWCGTPNTNQEAAAQYFPKAGSVYVISAYSNSTPQGLFMLSPSDPTRIGASPGHAVVNMVLLPGPFGHRQAVDLLHDIVTSLWERNWSGLEVHLSLAHISAILVWNRAFFATEDSFSIGTDDSNAIPAMPLTMRRLNPEIAHPGH